MSRIQTWGRFMAQQNMSTSSPFRPSRRARILMHPPLRVGGDHEFQHPSEGTKAPTSETEQLLLLVLVARSAAGANDFLPSTLFRDPAAFSGRARPRIRGADPARLRPAARKNGHCGHPTAGGRVGLGAGASNGRSFSLSLTSGSGLVTIRSFAVAGTSLERR